MNKLRELRNKILGEPKLEAGCEVRYIDNNYLFIKFDERDYDKTIILRDIDDFSKIIISSKRKDKLEIIGKPVTLQEVLLMMNNKIDKDTYLAINTSGLFHDYINDELVAIIRFDLTLPPEQQTPEVIEKIISLIE